MPTTNRRKTQSQNRRRDERRLLPPPLKIRRAALKGVSSELIAFGTAAAVPDFIPDEIKVPIAFAAWIAGVIEFSVKEALGGQGPAVST